MTPPSPDHVIFISFDDEAIHPEQLTPEHGVWATKEEMEELRQRHSGAFNFCDPCTETAGVRAVYHPNHSDKTFPPEVKADLIAFLTGSIFYVTEEEP